MPPQQHDDADGEGQVIEAHQARPGQRIGEQGQQIAEHDHDRGPGQHAAQMLAEGEAMPEDLVDQRPQRGPTQHRGQRTEHGRGVLDPARAGVHAQPMIEREAAQEEHHQQRQPQRAARRALVVLVRLQRQLGRERRVGAAPAQLAGAKLEQRQAIQAGRFALAQAPLAQPAAIEAGQQGQLRAGFAQAQLGMLGRHVHVVQHHFAGRRAADTHRPLGDLEHRAHTAFAIQDFDHATHRAAAHFFFSVHAKPSR